jgi:hypothetical protein
VASRTSSLSGLAGPATGQPVWLTIRLWPMKGWPRSLPIRLAAATNIELEWAAPMTKMLAMASRRGSWPGIGTQLVGTQTSSAPCRAARRKLSGNQQS